MSKQVLFIQGAGDGAHAVDGGLVKELCHELGSAYEVTYPTTPNEADARYNAWKHQAEKELDKLEGQSR